MASLTYLFRQDGRYFFRRRVPRDLGALIQKSEVKISLGAGCSRQDALTRAIHLTAIYQDYFSRLRAGNDVGEETARLSWRIQDLGNEPASQPVTAVTPANVEPLPAITAFLPTYMLEKSRGWSESGKRHNLNAIDLFIKIIGDKSIPDYDRQDIVNYMGTMERVHRTYGKSHKDKGRTITEILAVGSDKPKMSITTLVNHFRSVKALFKASNQYHDTGVNLEHLFGGQGYSKGVRQPDKRIPWSIADLNRLFATPIWAGTSEPKPSLRYKAGTKIIKDAYWWLPIIGIFTGMRLEEICQLQVGDLKADGGIHYLDVVEGNGKRLKTHSSARQVPLHGVLADIGILTLFTGKDATQRIFPELTRGGVDQKYGYEYSQDFSVYRRKTATYEEWKDYHSFRHTFISALWQATRDMVLVGSIVGHGGKENQTADYTHIALATKAEAISTLAYDGLAMEHLLNGE
jgi:integrase